jgi:hypothetical protein
MLTGDYAEHIAVTFFPRLFKRGSENDRTLLPCLEHECHAEIKMTPFAFLVPNDMHFITLEHSFAMRTTNFEANTVIGLVDIARRIVNGNPALLEFGDVSVGKSAIFFAPIPHRTYEIDVHETPFLTCSITREIFSSH